ncbi:TonB protein C-terminal [Sphingomonas gellani]|uniref:TonB protein C-terminal n=1 Tax=Sphingomonas gellani TaxID=1166340 RepID=A0A1H8AVV9_9SPHN|nr:energy transducer TonB [Sphingomonas gellani]SEM74961.1 TonB protein C-terminal [Sphingomonas gellani]
MAKFGRICTGILLAGTCSITLAASPVPPGDGRAVDQALTAHDYRRAAIELNTLVAQRLPPTDKAGPDPLLDRLLAQLISVNGSPASAITLLTRLTSDAKLRDLPHHRLLLATAREEAGQFKQAERDYQTVRADRDATADDRLSAALGYARLRMMESPDEAAAALQATQALPGQAWEVDLQRARAEALGGHEDASRASLGRAWAEAPLAGAEQAAAARVASDMLVAAGRTGERNRLIALLTVDRLNRGVSTGQDVLAADVPVCGFSGVRPEDSVAIQFVRQAAPGRPRFSLIWASRPGIATVFLNAVARDPDYRIQDGQATAIVLKCRTAPAADYQVKANLEDQVLSWSTARGAYPLLDTGDETDAAALASALAERERRYGPTSVMLLPVLQRILAATVAGGFGSQEARTRAAALSHRIADIIGSNGGPPDLALLSTLSATSLDVAAQNKSVAAAQADFQMLLEQAGKNNAVSLDTLYTLVSGATALSQAPSVLRTQLLDQALAVVRAHSSAQDPRTLALALRLIGVRSEQGNAEALSGLVREYGLAQDLCSVAAPAVKFTSSNITADDYPPDLIQALLQGRTVLEFSIDPTGVARTPRILVSDPPFAFDAVAVAKSSTLNYEPAKRAGTAYTCRAQTQAVRWQLPY